MAGKTLTGIGEDESGRHELALDQSDSAIRAAKPPIETKPEPKRPDLNKTILGLSLPPHALDELAPAIAKPAPAITKPPVEATKPPVEATKPPAQTNKTFPTINGNQASSTDRMPMFAGPGGGRAVDDDKVAEGLKKLRSLDEPLGPIPTTLKENIPALGLDGNVASGPNASSMPTLKEGIP